MLLRPASNMKLLTAATALSTLGKNFCFKTEMYSDTIINDSVLHGNIYLKGLETLILIQPSLPTFLQY